jgi:hypothetical protein
MTPGLGRDRGQFSLVRKGCGTIRNSGSAAPTGRPVTSADVWGFWLKHRLRPLAGRFANTQSLLWGLSSLRFGSAILQARARRSRPR